MTHEEAFMRDIADSPDDDTPRLVFADWLEDNGQPERAEFIRVQCARARLEFDAPGREMERGRPDFRGAGGGPTPPGAALRELERREQRLWRRHGDAWRGALPRLTGVKWEFLRGLPACVLITPKGFRTHADAVFAAAPVHALRHWAAGDEPDLPSLAASPHLARLTSLDLSAARIVRPEDVRALAGAPQLVRLNTLYLRYSRLGPEAGVALARCPARWRKLSLSSAVLGPGGAEALASCPRLADLHTLDLGHNDIGPRGIRALARAQLPNLRRLELSGNALGPEGAAELAAAPWLGQVRELHLARNRLGDAGVAMLAAAPVLAGLNWLNLVNNQITDEGARSLANSPFVAGLGVLDLRYDNPIGPAGARALAESPHLGRLHRLLIDLREIGAEALAALQARFGRRNVGP
jgi:uncharacterized protein (TIGR02996 family)